MLQTFEKFKKFKNKMKLSRLYNNKGKLLDKKGYIKNNNIFDYFGVEYPAGVTDSGKIYATDVKIDGQIINTEGNPILGLFIDDY